MTWYVISMRSLAVVAILLAACRVEPTASADDKKNGGPTVSEFKPNTAFHAYAAKVLSVSPGDIEGGAVDAKVAATSENSINGAWSYVSWLKSDHNREVRGWVTADATVISTTQNLGLLFKEAGVWDKPKNLRPLADQLAAAILWSYGDGYLAKPINDLDNGMPPPKLTVAEDGAGKLVFFVGYRQAGPGGAGGGPITTSKIDVELSVDHKATLTKTPK